MSGVKTVEVELRGPLDETSWSFLVDYCKKNARSQKWEERFLIDYSTFLEGIGSRRLDVRLRVTNGEVEIVVKEGKFGGTHRVEASVFVRDNNIDGALRLLALLGYRRGVACDRGIRRYQVGDIEIAIQEVRLHSQPEQVHSRFYEAEILTTEEGREMAEERIRYFLNSLNLKVFGEEEWNQYIEQMNGEANGVFEFSEDGLGRLVALYGRQ